MCSGAPMAHIVRFLGGEKYSLDTALVRYVGDCVEWRYSGTASSEFGEERCVLQVV